MSNLKKGKLNMKTTIKQRKAIHGGLSNPSKMPCPSFGLPAIETCPMGKKLSTVENSICSKCYGLKGMYTFSNVKAAQSTRYDLLLSAMLHDPKKWVDAMVEDIKGKPYFRWHDTGDIWSFDYLLMIIDVIQLTPDTKHWIPTKEVSKLAKLLRDGYTIPKNVTFRLSAQMIGRGTHVNGLKHPQIVTCGTMYKGHTKRLKDGEDIDIGGFICPAWKQYKTKKNGKKDYGHCNDCRKCWDKHTETVWYPLH